MTSPNNTEYDIVFAGGGTAACLIAGRLATADPNLKILILEAGIDSKDLPIHNQPANYRMHLSPVSTTIWIHIGKPTKHVGDRMVPIITGRCIGGSSAMNFAMYTRPAASDYDDWEVKYKNPGWGSKDLIPLLKKCETYEIDPKGAVHGDSGPLHVSWGGKYLNVAQEFLATAGKYDTSRKSHDDPNDFHTADVYGRWAKWIDGKSGKRSDTASGYIYNGAHSNITIVTSQRVKRVIFEGKRAVGVEFVDENPPGLAEKTVKVAKAAKMVVLTAGAFGSPTILERSGVGNAAILKKLNIEVTSDVPGVGENFQDHHAIFPPYKASEDAETMDALFRGDPDVEAASQKLWHETGQGIIAHNGVDAGIKIRPHEEDFKELGPEFEAAFKSYFAPAPDKGVAWLGPFALYLGDPSTTPKRNFYYLAGYSMHPLSRGSLHVTSEDPFAPTDFDCGFLSEDADLALLRWVYKKSRELARRMKYYRGAYAVGHPEFPEGSQAKPEEDEAGPVPIDAPDIVYTKEDDQAIETYIRKTVATTWHSMGTCAMKPKEEGGVVDSRLNVYGVENLKVADMSIAPGNVSANTYSTACAIGEKAALIIAEELGIKGV